MIKKVEGNQQNGRKYLQVMCLTRVVYRIDGESLQHTGLKRQIIEFKSIKPEKPEKTRHMNSW